MIASDSHHCVNVSINVKTSTDLGEKCHNISEHCMDPDAGCEEEVDLEVGICLAELSDLQVYEDDLQVYEDDLHGRGPGEVPASCQ